MNPSHRPTLQTATGWLLALAFVFTCGVPVPARGNFQKPASVFQNQKDQTGLPAGTYGFDANDRLLSDVYDANGNTIASESKSDSYDFEDRLVSRTEPGKGITVVYDGDGNRVRETVTVGATTTEVSYLVDELNHTGHAQVVEELVNGVVVKSYTYGHDLLAQDQRENAAEPWMVSWYGYDGHGNVRYLTDATGSVTDAYDYDAFGVALRTAGSTANRYRYSGEQYDEALGLYYLRARYFNALGGRFWSMDSFEGSMGDPASLHKYTYANNDPVNMVDPSGHYSIAEGSFVQSVGSTARLMTQNLMKTLTSCKAKSVGAGAAVGAVVNASVGGGLTAVIGYFNDTPAAGIGAEILKGLPAALLEGAIMGAAANFGGAVLTTALAVQFGRSAYEALEAFNDPNATDFYKGMMLANLIMDAAPFVSKSIRGKLKEFLEFTFCFSGDTLVATKDGEQAIDSIEAGQEVWAADPITGERKLSRVVAKTVSIATALLVLNIGGEEVQATETHPFQVVGQGMTAAGNLKVGDQIERRSGESAAVESIALRVGRFPVYNIEVADAHTYFVGHQELLVHNGCHSKKLGDDMIDNGLPKPGSAYEAAHLIPTSNFSGRSAKVQAAIKLAQNKFDTHLGADQRDRIINGFWAQSGHLGTHTDKFFLALGESFKSVNSPEQARAVITSLLAKVKLGEFLK